MPDASKPAANNEPVWVGLVGKVPQVAARVLEVPDEDGAPPIEVAVVVSDDVDAVPPTTMCPPNPAPPLPFALVPPATVASEELVPIELVPPGELAPPVGVVAPVVFIPPEEVAAGVVVLESELVPPSDVLSDLYPEPDWDAQPHNKPSHAADQQLTQTRVKMCPRMGLG